MKLPKLPNLPKRDWLWLMVVAVLSLTWLYSDTSLRRRLAAAEATVSNLEADRASFQQREAALAQQEQDVAEKKETYRDLIKDVEVVKRKCESILDDYADLRNKARIVNAGAKAE